MTRTVRHSLSKYFDKSYLCFGIAKICLHDSILKVGSCLLNKVCFFGYCCHMDEGAQSDFICGLETIVYKDVKPGGYAWLNTTFTRNLRRLNACFQSYEQFRLYQSLNTHLVTFNLVFFH